MLMQSRTLLLGLLSLVAGVAQAKAPRVVQLLGKNLIRHGYVEKSKHANAPQCANFSGSWKGTCVDQDGQTYSDTLDLTQEDCDAITISGLDANIGGSSVVSSQPNPNAEKHFSYSGTFGYAWNDSQSKLNSLTSVSFFDGAYAFIVRSSMWLAGDQLRTKDDAGAALSIDGTQGMNATLQDCTYDRTSSSR
jgi:hypothetical protein